MRAISPSTHPSTYMLEKLSSSRSLIARLGVSGEPGAAGRYVRAILAVVQEAPAVGWAFKGAGAALKELSDAESDDQLEERLELLLSSSNQSRDTLRALSEMAAVLLLQQEEVRRAVTAKGLRTDVLQLTSFAKAAALATYRARVAQEHQYADYRGVDGAMRDEYVASLELDSIYVLPQLIREQEQATVQRQELSMLRKLLDDQDMLPQERIRLEKDYAVLTGQRWSGIAETPESAGMALGTALREYPLIVIIGNPGVGKSALTRYVARSAALGYDALRERLGWAEDLIPVRVALAEFSEARRQAPRMSLREFINEWIEQVGGAALRLALDEQMETGGVLVLLDGIDEVAESVARADVVDAVDQFIGDHPCRVLVTSRPYGYIRLKGDLPHFTLSNFSRKQQDDFVHRWYRSYEEKQHTKSPDYRGAAAEATALLAEIRRNSKVAELATNPLMLVIVSLIRNVKTRLPEERVQLYHSAVNTLIDTWNQWRSRPSVDMGGVSLSPDRLVRVWAAVAEWTRREHNTGVVHRAELKQQLVRVLTDQEFDEDDPESTAESYLRAAAHRAGLIEERGPGVFAFWHATFEEFLAAVELSTPVANTTRRLLLLRDDPRWREVILLAVGYLGIVRREQETATEVVRSLMEDQPGALEAVFHANLLIAAACVADDVGVKRSLTEEVIRRLAAVLVAKPYDRFESAYVSVCEALPKLRVSSDTVESLQALLSSESQKVRTQTARLLANVASGSGLALAACKELLLDAVENVRTFGALGVLRAGEHNRDSLVQVSLPKFDFLVGAESIHQLLAHVPHEYLSFLECGLDDDDRAVRSGAAKLLIYTYNPQVLDRALRVFCEVNFNGSESITWPIAQHDGAPETLVRAAHANAAVFDALVRALNMDDPGLQTGAMSVLGKIGRPTDALVEGLTRLLCASDPNLQLSAAESLVTLGMQDRPVVAVLLDALVAEHPNSNTQARLRTRAVNCIASIGPSNEILVNELLGTLSASDATPVLRYNAAVALIRLGCQTEAVAHSVATLLNTNDDRIRRLSVDLLRMINPSDTIVVNAWASALESDDPDVRLKAAESMLKLGQPSDVAMAVLIEALDAEDAETRIRAVDLLMDLGKADDRVVRILLCELADPQSKEEEGFRLMTLAETNDLVVGELVEMLRSSESVVRKRAAETLGLIGRADDAVIRALAGALRTDDSVLDYLIVSALGHLGSIDGPVLEAVAELLLSDEPYLRIEVSEFLIKQGRSDLLNVAVLVDMLGVEDAYLAQQAGRLLRWLAFPAGRVNASATKYHLARRKGIGNQLVIEAIVRTLWDQPWEALAALQRISEDKTPTWLDGQALCTLVTRQSSDTAQQKAARSLLFTGLSAIYV